MLYKEENAPGYLVFVLNCISGLLRPIVETRKPLILVNETYGGSGDYVLEYSEAIEKGYPVTGVSTREPQDPILLRRMVNYLILLDELRRTRVLFIVPKAVNYYLNLEYPLSVDVYGLLKQLSAVTGASYIVMNSEEFREKFYSKVDSAEAEEVAKKWIMNSAVNLEKDYIEIFRSAKLYLAIKKAAEEKKANVIALDCIVLRNTGELDAWPCLAYMQ